VQPVPHPTADDRESIERRQADKMPLRQQQKLTSRPAARTPEPIDQLLAEIKCCSEDRFAIPFRLRPAGGSVLTLFFIPNLILLTRPAEK